MVEENSEFTPDWVSPPGATILYAIKEKNWTQVQLAKRLGISNKHMNHLVKGKVAITDDMAFRLAAVSGSTEQFWLRREAQYRQWSAQLKAEARYRNWQYWLNEFPINELKNAGILPQKRLVHSAKPEFVELLLRFFRVATPDEWKINYLQMQEQFRCAHNNITNLGATTAWLCQGEIEAEKIEVDVFYSGYSDPIIQYSRKKFKNALKKFRTLTNDEFNVFQPVMKSMCLEAGVIVALVPSIPKAKASGAARWYRSTRPMIQLSPHGKTNDEFWLTFFHEAAHILLHSKKKKDIFIDDRIYSKVTDSVELEANEFAENMLIPLNYKSSLSNLNSRHEIEEFASEIGIHPGIVVGRLQKEKIISRARFNDLKERYEFSDN